MRSIGRSRDEETLPRHRSTLDESTMISFKPDWMKGNEQKSGRDRPNDPWRDRAGGGRAARSEQRDWNKGAAASRERGWDRGRNGERPTGYGGATQTKGRFVPPPMNRSQSAGANLTFSPKESHSLLFSKDNLPPIVKVPAPATKTDKTFQNREADFPTLQPPAPVNNTSNNGKKQNLDSPNARSRFHKSKSTNALLEQNNARNVSSGSILLERAGVLEETKVMPSIEHSTVEGDVNIVVPNSVSVTAPIETTPQDTTPQQEEEEEQSDKPKLKKIPSFSEKVVEAIVAGQNAAKTEGNQANKEEVEQVHLLVPSKPAPPRLIKSRSDRGHLLDHRKPLNKPAGAKGAETAPIPTPKPQPEIVQIQPKPQEAVVTKTRKVPSPSVYRKATSEPQLLHLWNNKDGSVPGARAAVTESDDSAVAKKEGKNGRVVDKQLELRQQKRFIFLEQLRIREAIKNGELTEEEEQKTGQESGGEEKGEGINGCTAETTTTGKFSEEAVVNLMKQMGWSEEEDLDEGLTEEELLGVLPLDPDQINKERERRKEHLELSLRQWQPPAKNAGGVSLNAPLSLLSLSDGAEGCDLAPRCNNSSANVVLS